MKTTLISVVLALAAARISFALPPAATIPSPPAAASSPSQATATDTLRLRLAAGRGDSGQPAASTNATPIVDPRAVQLGDAIARSTVLQRAALETGKDRLVDRGGMFLAAQDRTASGATRFPLTMRERSRAISSQP